MPPYASYICGKPTICKQMFLRKPLVLMGFPHRTVPRGRALRIHLHGQRELHVPRVPQQELQRVVREAVAGAKVHEGILGDFRGKLRQLSCRQSI